MGGYILRNIGRFSGHLKTALLIALIVLPVALISRTILSKNDTGPKLPVLILDENKRITGARAGDTPETLKANKINLFPEDRVTTELILNPVRDLFVGEKIIIKRAPTFYVLADGKTTTVRSWDSYRDAILKSTSLKVNRLDIINPSKNKELTPGASITITRVNEEKIEVSESIPFETINKGSTAIPFGTQRVTQAGKNGKQIKKYLVTYKNGVEVSRELLGVTLVSRPVNKIISSGMITGKKALWGPYYENNYGPYTCAFYRAGYKGRYILITNNANGKQVRVKIVDFGPKGGPFMDLSTTAYKVLGGSTSHGHIDSVSVQLVD